MRSACVAIALLGITLGVASCSHPTRPGPVVAGERYIAIDGRQVLATPKHSLFDLLRSRIAPSRLAGRTTHREVHPLVMIDGVVMSDGLLALKGVKARDAESVTVMPRSDAMTRFGMVAGNGAIVVRTRRGF